MRTGCLGLISGKSIEDFVVVVAVLVIVNFSGHFLCGSCFPFVVALRKIT